MNLEFKNWKTTLKQKKKFYFSNFLFSLKNTSHWVLDIKIENWACWEKALNFSNFHLSFSILPIIFQAISPVPGHTAFPENAEQQLRSDVFFQANYEPAKYQKEENFIIGVSFSAFSLINTSVSHIHTDDNVHEQLWKVSLKRARFRSIVLELWLFGISEHRLKA